MRSRPLRRGCGETRAWVDHMSRWPPKRDRPRASPWLRCMGVPMPVADAEHNNNQRSHNRDRGAAEIEVEAGVECQMFRGSISVRKAPAPGEDAATTITCLEQSQCQCGRG
jgi:hypothetical protein